MCTIANGSTFKNQIAEFMHELEHNTLNWYSKKRGK